MEQQISNSQKNSVNIPPVSSIPSPLSGPYQYSATTPTSSSIPLTNSHNLRTSSFKLGQNNLYNTNSFNTTVSTSPFMISSPSKSRVNSSSSTPNIDINNIDLISLINQCPSSVNIWDSIQSIVQSINKELPNNQLLSIPISGASSITSSAQSVPSNSSSNRGIYSIPINSNSSKEKEELLDQFRQQQINHINQLNANLMKYNNKDDYNRSNSNNNTSNYYDESKLNFISSKEDNKSANSLGSSLKINSPQLNNILTPNLLDANSKYEIQKSYRASINPLTLNRNGSLKASIYSGNDMDQENIFLTETSPKLQVPGNDKTIDEKIASSYSLNELKNSSVLEAVDDNHYNYDIDFDDLENKLIIDIPIEINPVIEKIRGLRKNREIQLMIDKISEYCEEKLQRIANTLLYDIEMCITEILVLAPFVLSKVSYILDPTYSQDIINSSTTSNFMRSTTSLLSYTKIVLALHDTWYLNGPQDIDIKVTQGICSKLLEAISSIRRKVDRIKMKSEGKEAKNNLQASYPQLISTCYFYVTLLDDLMNSIVKIDSLSTSSTLNRKSPDPIALLSRQRHPPRGESLSVQYKLTENSKKIENFINRVEVGSKKLNMEKNLKTINTNDTKDIPTHDILSMSYINNKNKGGNNLIRNEHVYMQDGQFTYKKNNNTSRNTYTEIKNINNNNHYKEQYDDEERSEDDQENNKRKKYATFINLDENENIIQKYKQENNIIEEEDEEDQQQQLLASKQEKLNENEAYYISRIKNYKLENNYDPISSQSTPIIDSAEHISNENNYNELDMSTLNYKASISNNNLHKNYIEEDDENDYENDEAYYTYILQKNRKNKFKGRTLTKTSSSSEITEQQQQLLSEPKVEHSGAIDNEMSYLDNGNKTITIYKETKNSELNVKNVEKKDEKSKHDHKKSLSEEKSFKKKLLRYERKQIRKEIEASEKRSVIFDDIKYFRRNQNSFNIKNFVNQSEASTDNSYFSNKYAINKGTIYFFEEGREVIGFEVTSEKISIVSGTVEKLLLRLANESTYNEEYVDTFIQYHQFFISSVDLMHNLIARFNVQLENKEDADEQKFNKWRKQIQLKVIYALNRWISIQYNCFVKNALVHALLEYFISAIWSSGFKNEADRLKRNATKIILSSSAKYRNLPFNLIPIRNLTDDDISREITINLTNSSILYDFDSKTIAKYLCVVDQEIFSVVTWHDIASKLSNSYKNEEFEFIKPSLRFRYEKEIEEDKKFDENPIDLMTKRSNLIRNWVAMEICSVQNIKTRKYLIRKFIEIAKYSREFNNFHSALFIVSGLLSPPVQRLKQTWELINNKEITTLNNLEKLLSPVSNMKYYRKAIAMAKGPVVPFFPIIMKDFRFIIDGNPTFKTLPSGVELVNFERYKIMNKVLNTIKKYSTEKYPFTQTFLPIIQRLPVLMKKKNRTLLTKDYISDPKRNSSGSGTNTYASSQQTYHLSPVQTPSIPSNSDTPTLFSPDLQSPNLSYANKSQVYLPNQSQGLFSLTLNPHHSFQNITNNAFSLFHNHNSSSLPTDEIEDIAVYIESRLYGKGFCSLSLSSLTSTFLNNPSLNSTSTYNKTTPLNVNTVNSNIDNDNINNINNINSNNNNNVNNISSNNVNSNNSGNTNNNSSLNDLNEIMTINNSLYLDDNILTHILCSEFEIQNQKIAYDLSLACEPPNSVSTSSSSSTFIPSSPKTSNDGSFSPSSIKISYQKYINDTSTTKLNFITNTLNEDSMEASLAEKSLSIILNTNPKIKNFDYKTNEIEDGMENEAEVNVNLSKIIPNDIHMNLPETQTKN
ncbi:ras GEF [Neocallimastix californiae]|uniref:Ras GEF n=1 Tax=Neocallimastix californiae TaxID=1754190 RepID=A0A1Y2AE37_9FUNG|nr:ras GEF [Neocallimastix californiae]|eukprot:ORY20734.1 ras GEF [Neocallimastix californiae]